jgi:hypothetical protein
MKRTITLTYEWRRTASAEIKPEHIEALEESAEETIFARLSEGYREGSLCDYIRMDESDGDDGAEYTGWFTIQKT